MKNLRKKATSPEAKKKYKQISKSVKKGWARFQKFADDYGE